LPFSVNVTDGIDNRKRQYYLWLV